jgi:hypothetical protein
LPLPDEAPAVHAKNNSSSNSSKSSSSKGELSGSHHQVNTSFVYDTQDQLEQYRRWAALLEQRVRHGLRSTSSEKEEVIGCSTARPGGDAIDSGVSANGCGCGGGGGSGSKQRTVRAPGGATMPAPAEQDCGGTGSVAVHANEQAAVLSTRNLLVCGVRDDGALG